MLLYHEKTLCEINRNNITNSNSCYWNRFSWYLISFTVTFRDHTWILHEKVFKCFAQFFFSKYANNAPFSWFQINLTQLIRMLNFSKSIATQVCTHTRAFEQGGIFIVPYTLLWHGSTVFRVSHEGLPCLVAKPGVLRTYSNTDPEY